MGHHPQEDFIYGFELDEEFDDTDDILVENETMDLYEFADFLKNKFILSDDFDITYEVPNYCGDEYPPYIFGISWADNPVATEYEAKVFDIEKLQKDCRVIESSLQDIFADIRKYLPVTHGGPKLYTISSFG